MSSPDFTREEIATVQAFRTARADRLLDGLAVVDFTSHPPSDRNGQRLVVCDSEQPLLLGSVRLVTSMPTRCAFSFSREAPEAPWLEPYEALQRLGLWDRVRREVSAGFRGEPGRNVLLIGEWFMVFEDPVRWEQPLPCVPGLKSGFWNYQRSLRLHTTCQPHARRGTQKPRKPIASLPMRLRSVGSVSALVRPGLDRETVVRLLNKRGAVITGDKYLLPARRPS